ncbi:MAG: peroxidase-related enzyme [Pyrinomonadaceae bacterium]
MSFLREEPFDEKDFPTLQLIKNDYGFIPNFFRTQTARPDILDAEVGLVDSILIKEGALTRSQKENIFLVCSAANLSTYCVTAHCEIIRMLKLEGPEPEQIALDHMSTDLPIVEKALLNFALKLNNHALKVTQEDIDDLRTYGFTDQQILEAVMCVGLAKFANYVGFGLGTVPDFKSRIDLEKSKAVMA